MIQESRDGKADKVKKLRDRESQDGSRHERRKSSRKEGRAMKAKVAKSCPQNEMTGDTNARTNPTQTVEESVEQRLN